MSSGCLWLYSPVYVLIMGTNLCLWTKIRGDKIISLCLHQFFIMKSVIYWPKWISMDLRWKQSCITGSDSKLWKQKIPQGKCIYSRSSPNLLFLLYSNCDRKSSMTLRLHCHLACLYLGGVVKEALNMHVLPVSPTFLSYCSWTQCQSFPFVLFICSNV